MKIKTKLITGFAVLLLLFMGVSGFFISRIASLGDLTTKMYQHPLTVTRASLRANNQILQIQNSMKQLALADSQASINQAIAEIEASNKKVSEQLQLVSQRIMGRKGEQLLEDTKALFLQWKQLHNQEIQQFQSGQSDAGYISSQVDSAEQANLLTENIKQLTAYADGRASGLIYHVQSTQDEIYNQTIVLAIMTTLLILGLVFYLIHSILKPITQLHQSINYISENYDLSTAAPVYRNDEIGSMTEAFNHMLDKFKNNLSRVSQSITTLNSATQQLTNASEKTRHRVQQQNVVTDQAANTANQMSVTVLDIACSIAKATKATEATKHEMRDKGKVVKAAIDGMSSLASDVDQIGVIIDKIKKDSNNIGSLLNMIKSITEQTNLLALDAAIEATHAEEQGGSSTVVAEKIRSLARQTQESSHKIQSAIELLQTDTHQAINAIEHCSKRAQSSKELAANAAVSLQLITSIVEKLMEINTLIASKSQQPCILADSIQHNIAHIKAMTYQTSGEAGLSADTGRQLNVVTANLQKWIEQFKLSLPEPTEPTEAKSPLPSVSRNLQVLEHRSV